MARGKQAMFDEANYEIKQDAQQVQNTQNAQPIHDASYTMRTKKNRAQKLPRINMAFYNDNLDYVREAAWEARMSITEYINSLIEADRKQKGR